MKYSMNVEMTEKETESLGNFILKLVSMVHAAERSMRLVNLQNLSKATVEIKPEKAPEPENKPAEPSTIDQDLMQSQPSQDERLERMKHAAKEGEIVFAYFIGEWARNFMSDGEQPDRGKLLTETMNMNSLEMLSFIRLSGGLTNAVIKVSSPSDKSVDQREFIKKCRLIAENIAQVSSILYPPVAEHLEYPFKIQ